MGSGPHLADRKLPTKPNPCSLPMGPPPAPPLPEELVEEILVRVPPSDPARLARAAVASKRWCRLVTGAGFRRRYRAHHGAAPMLGFLSDPCSGDGFVPTSSFRIEPCGEDRVLRPLDARHGRVLFLRPDADDLSGGGGGGGGIDLLVWDPITDEMVELPRPPLHQRPVSWKAAVLCAVPAADCDHLDCHRGHFLVVLVVITRHAVRICVFSSEAAAWPAAEGSPYDFSFTIHDLFPFQGGWRLGSRLCQGRSPLVGNALYFMCGDRILMYDWCRQHYSIEEPILHSNIKVLPLPRKLITMGDGRLAFAAVKECRLYIVPRDGELGWGEVKTITFEKLPLRYSSQTDTLHVVGFAEGNGLVFLRIGNEIFSLDTRAAMPTRLKKVCEGSFLVPYINFCTPVMGVQSSEDGQQPGASTDEWSGVATSLPSQGK